MKTPSWVFPVVRAVAMNNGRKHEPRIRFIKRNRMSTSGCYYRHNHSITICAGRDDTQHKWVLLHELAHWLTRKGHTKKFWAKAFALYEDFGVTQLAIDREFRYKKKASLVFTQRKEVK